jgi:glycosyltransferase involved in cell wall biosynthesis
MQRVPRVSVLLPVHNPGPYLGPALASLRGQTLGDTFEVVCVDDGCSDGSGEALDRVAAADPRFRVLHPGRVGLIEAANLAAREARGQYRARFDADDAMHPRRLELQAAWLDDHPAEDVVASRVRHFPRPEVLGGNLAYEEWLNASLTHEEIAREFLVESPIPNPSAMWRPEVFERAGGYRDDGLPEDYDFWLRAFEAGARFAKLPEVLHFWRDHGARVTRTHPRYSVEAFLRAKAGYLQRGPLAGKQPYVIWGAGMIGRRLARLLVRAGRPPVALLDIDRAKVGRTRQGRPILPPEAWRPGSTLLLGAVGARGARALIRERLDCWGLVETRDYWMLA